VDVHVAAVIAGKEAEALVHVEPLDLAGGHCDLLRYDPGNERTRLWCATKG